MVLWAANFIVVKDAIATLPPVAFTMLRYALASIALLVILRWYEGSVSVPRPDTLRILVLGGLGFGLYQILWTTGLTSIPAGDSALIIASTPVLVAVLAVIIGADTLTPTKFAGALLSFLGVVVVIAAGVGVSMSGSADRQSADARRRRVLGVVHRVRRAGPAPPLTAGADDLGHGRRARSC